MPFYRTADGQATVHLNFGRVKKVPAPCAAPRLPGDNPSIGDRCLRSSAKLCDGPVGTDLAQRPLTCDMPICEQHATHVDGQDLDYCPRHAALATREVAH